MQYSLPHSALTAVHRLVLQVAQSRCSTLCSYSDPVCEELGGVLHVGKPLYACVHTEGLMFATGC